MKEGCPLKECDMGENTSGQLTPPPRGAVEPHAPLLKQPPDSQLLYKIMTVKNFLSSIVGNYLHFNRVDCYSDFPGADQHDGQQLPQDLKINETIEFMKDQNFNAACYYNQSRSRTYACCFSMKNSDYIWNNYANDSSKGKLCIVFNFGRLRATINQVFAPGNAAVIYDGKPCFQIFDVNYGIIKYVDWNKVRTNKDLLRNPIIYTYLKDNSFSEENELRITLSTIGLCSFMLNSGSNMAFPSSLQLGFNFTSAISNGIIKEILYNRDTDLNVLRDELRSLHIDVNMQQSK